MLHYIYFLIIILFLFLLEPFYFYFINPTVPLSPLSLKTQTQIQLRPNYSTLQNLQHLAHEAPAPTLSLTIDTRTPACLFHLPIIPASTILCTSSQKHHARPLTHFPTNLRAITDTHGRDHPSPPHLSSLAWPSSLAYKEHWTFQPWEGGRQKKKNLSKRDSSYLKKMFSATQSLP